MSARLADLVAQCRRRLKPTKLRAREHAAGRQPVEAVRGGGGVEWVQGQPAAATVADHDDGQEHDDEDFDREQELRCAQRRPDALERQEHHRSGWAQADQPPRRVDVELGPQRSLEVGADQRKLGGRQQCIGDEHQPAGDETGPRAEASGDPTALRRSRGWSLANSRIECPTPAPAASFPRPRGRALHRLAPPSRLR